MVKFLRADSARDLHHLCWLAVELRRQTTQRVDDAGSDADDGPTALPELPHAAWGKLWDCLRHAPPSGPEVLAAGLEHTSAVVTAERPRLVCFGSNSFGQCAVPEDLGPVNTIAAGTGHTCAIPCRGRAPLLLRRRCLYRQCQLSGDLGAVTAVAAGGFHTCAIRAEDGCLFSVSETMSTGNVRCPLTLAR